MKHTPETLELLAEKNIADVRNTDVAASWIKTSHFLFTLSVVALLTICVAIFFSFRTHIFDVKSVQKTEKMN